MTGATTRWRHGPLWLLALLALVTVTVLGAAACGDDDDESADTAGGGGAANEDVSGTISVLGIWAGQEQEGFQAVIDAFNEAYPNVTVNYDTAGDNLPTVLQTAVQGGNPPDISFIAQPGTIQAFVDDGALQPIEFAREDLVANQGESGAAIGSFNDQLYGILFKAANKSLGWYNTQVFEDAGVEPPETYEDLGTTADTIRASGVAPFSIAGADGWTLTDLFENIYLRSAGPEKYDQLANHEIPWTDPSVIEALDLMKTVIGNPQNIPGGPRAALQRANPEAVAQLFTDPPRAGIYLEGDFVQGNILNETDAQEGDYGVFTFPSVNGSEPAVVTAGDLGVMFRDSPSAQAFMRFLTTPEAAEAWAARGGFLSPNQNVDSGVYPDAIAQQIAEDFAAAENVRFDLSDLTPPAFGATIGSGMWKILQDFLRNPGDSQATAQQLEAAATRAD